MRQRTDRRHTGWQSSPTVNELVHLVTSVPFCSERHFAASCFLICDLASDSAVLYNWPGIRRRRCRCRHYSPLSFSLVAGLPIAEAMVVAEPGWLAETRVNAIRFDDANYPEEH